MQLGGLDKAIAEGRRAPERGAWAEARESFARALAEAETFAETAGVVTENLRAAGLEAR
jgi:hypothetical protein